MSPATTPTALAAFTPQAKRRRWPRRTGWLLLALLLAVAFNAMSVLGGVLPTPLDITVNGTSLASGLDLATLPAAHELAVASVVAVVVAVALGLAVAALLVVGVALVPVLVALGLAVAALLVVAVALVPVLLLTVGLPVLIGGVVLLVLFSPFVLLTWCLWRALRRPRPATMPA